jgi:hypothetical protein
MVSSLDRGNTFEPLGEHESPGKARYDLG